MALFLIFICLMSYVETLNPGLRLRISKDGLNYANNVAVKMFSKEIKNSRLNDISGVKLGVQYKLSHLIVKDFKPPKSTITLASESDLTWKGTNIGLEVDGAFEYKGRIISGNGNFVVTLVDLSFGAGVQIGLSTSGRPTVKTSDCSSDIGNVKIRFSGKAAWIYNVLSVLTKTLISKLLREKVCEKIKDIIDKDAEETLSTLQVQMHLGEFLTLDYRLLSVPSVTSEYIEGDMKGEVLWSGDKTEAPFMPPEMATVIDNKKMVYLTLSEYTFNSWSYQAHKHNILVYNLTAKDFTGNSSILNTTCESRCIGKTIPQIGKLYPNSRVELHMKSTAPPFVSISEEAFDIVTEGNVTVYARTTDNSIHYLLSVYAILKTSLKIKMVEQKIFASIAQMIISTNLTNSTVGEIADNVLQQLAKAILEDTRPMINGYLHADGFPLPSTDNLEYKDSDCKLLKNTILIETNLEVTPTVRKWMSNVLRFKPRKQPFSVVYFA